MVDLFAGFGSKRADVAPLPDESFAALSAEEIKSSLDRNRSRL